MADVKFKRGQLSQLPQALSDGTIYVTTDEGGIYVDTATKRVRLGDFVTVDTVSDLPADPKSESALYYVKTGNILARWDSTSNPTRWIQINKAGVVSVTNDANNAVNANVVTNITTSTDATGQLTLILHKATVATSSDLEALAGRVYANEQDIATINGDENTSGSIAHAVAEARAALLGTATTYTTLGAIETALLAIETVANRADTTSAANASAITTIQGDIVSMTEDIGDLQDAVDILNGDSTVEGSVDKKVALAIAQIVANAPSSLDDLEEIATWITQHGTDAAGMLNRIVANETAITNIQGDIVSMTDDIDDLSDAVEVLNGNSNTPGSVAYQIAAAIATEQARITALENSMTTVQGNITTIQGDITSLEDKLTWHNFVES